MNFQNLFISTTLLAFATLSGALPTLAQQAEGENAVYAEAQYEADLTACNPSSHVIPSLIGAFTGLELINRSNIKGYDADKCVVEYTFATPEAPETEATYLLCAFSQETMAQMLASEESGEAVDISDDCEFYDSWTDELDLMPE
jgi:hypothetical protein